MPQLPAALPGQLLQWYDENRRILPWREKPSPYRTWISEVMLQQTRVEAGIAYFERFTAALPDIPALAAVEEQQLLKLWEGLGYYSRARNLKKAATLLMEQHNGALPADFAALCHLPGLGEYSAGAIASIAFARPGPAVDGNALRVAARTAAIRENVLDPAVRRSFRALLAEAMPQDRPGAFNQALMDLGATVCLPSGQPLCGGCPLASLCQARRLGLWDQLPVRAKKPKRRVEEMTVYLLLREGRAALRKRPETGLLAGLWEFPHVPGTLTETEAAAPLAGWGLTPLDWREKIETKHVFTHVEWHMTGYLLTVRGECPGLLWADRDALEKLAVPSAFARYLREAMELLDGEQHQ